MSPAAVDRARVFQIFEQALSQQGPGRAGWVATACAGDRALQAAVEALLRDEESTGPETGTLLGAVALDPARLIGSTFGRFRIVSCIGAGGMGAVFRAERTDGLDQKVALKLLRAGLAGPQVVRFEREMKTLARLDHPAVAHLIDAGTAEDGTPWIAMELIDGEPIDVYCATHGVSLRERVRLLAGLADAVAFAHRMFVVHRDIKPGNVLMTKDGAPKLIDFGIAKLLDERSPDAPLTQDGGPLFTPGYAAPEQVAGTLVSTATDVFGLGALGYRLLTGQTLFPEAQSALPYMLAVTQRDVKLASRAALDRGAAAEARELRGDLDVILAKALARETAQRYQTAADLREDLQRYLDYRPVEARRQSLAYQAGKFLRRNPLTAALVAVLIAGTITAGAVYAWQARQVATERDAARAASARAERINKFLVAMLQAPDPSAGGQRDVTVAQVLSKAALEARQLVPTEPLVAAELLFTVSQADQSLGRFAEALEAIDAALQLWRAKPGHERQVAPALVARSEALMSLGRQAEAEGPAREAIALLSNDKTGAAEVAADLGRARDALGVMLTNSNREPEAEKTYRAALEDFRRAGVSDGRLGAVLNNLAILLGNQGKADESWKLQSQSLEVMRKVFPEDHPQVLSAKLSSAGALEALSRREEAIPLYREVIASRLRVLGPEHRDTLWAQVSLASNFSDMGRFAEAVELARPAAEQLSKTLGEGHPIAAFGWNVVGGSSCGLGLYDQGIAALKKAEKARIALLGDQSWLTANTRVRIGICLVGAGRYAQAEALLLPAEVLLEKARGPGFERTQDALRALRDLYAGWGRPDEAAKYAARLLKK